MNSRIDPAGRRLAATGFWALCFALAYNQSPLFTSNQNQYFLHGLARAGFGGLEADWLASTLDPTPAFSLLVEKTYLLAGSWPFYLEYGLIMGVYLFSLLAIAQHVTGVGERAFERSLFLSLAILVHSAALRYPLGRLPGPHWEYLLEAGVAGQRLLGPVFQPSVFGALLLTAVALYLRGRPFLAVASAATAATVHPTYLLSAAVLIGTFSGLEFVLNHRLRRAALLSILGLALSLPILTYTWAAFRPTSASAWAQAAEVLVNFRIPHHAVPAEWLDITVVLKLAALVAALWLARRSAVFSLLLLPCLVALALTLGQIWSATRALALLMPWRLSTFLLPLAMAILLGELVRWGLARGPIWLRGRWGGPAARFLAAGLAILGLAGAIHQHSAKASQPEVAVMDYVHSHLADGQAYFIPPKMQDFRLASGAPAFVDFKSIPYKDIEVLEWFERLRLAEFFFRDNPTTIDCGLLDEARRFEAITHVVLEADQFGLDCHSLEELYKDSHYAVYRISTR